MKEGFFFGGGGTWLLSLKAVFLGVLLLYQEPGRPKKAGDFAIQRLLGAWEPQNPGVNVNGGRVHLLLRSETNLSRYVTL